MKTGLIEHGIVGVVTAGKRLGAKSFKGILKTSSKKIATHISKKKIAMYTAKKRVVKQAVHNAVISFTCGSIATAEIQRRLFPC